jgi:superfamily II DNA or RNA helicase
MEIINNKTSERTVKTIANNILPSCDELFFEVGYFYFSGFEQIYEQLKNKKIKIMIGIGYDSKVAQLAQSNLGLKNGYFDYLKKDINTTNILEQKIGQDSYNMFVEKIKNGSLEIKCWKEKNDHSKIFVFKYSTQHNQQGLTPGIVLSGSSNLTKSGFLNNIEGNYLFRDPRDYEGHLKQFNERWNSDRCIDILNDQNFEEFETKVIKKTWINRIEKPYDLYIKVLNECFPERKSKETLMPKELSDGRFFNVKYQEDAIVKGINILEKHQGVIIADVVGLGKSIIAMAIAKNLNLNTITICPPHLIDLWEDYLTTALVPKNVVSRGSIENAFRHERKSSENLIIIDEAHTFRNDLTTDYSLLHKLCQNNKVMLLSATPFNNKPQDIFNMIKLFQIPTKSSLQSIENLSEQFKDLVKEYNEITKVGGNNSKPLKTTKEKEANVANQIRAILSPLLIRRSRIDLENIDRYQEDLNRKKIKFPIRKDPILINYDLGDLKDLYMDTVNIIAPKSKNNDSDEYIARNIEGNYLAARYRSATYVLPKFIADVAARADIEKELLKKSLENIADFMKRLLVRRFESCIPSFMISLDSLINSTLRIKNYYEKLGIVPIFKKGNIPDAEDFLDSSDDIKNIEEFEDLPKVEAYKEKGMFFIYKNELNDQFYKDLVNDVEILQNLKKTWQEKINTNFVDPKFEKFYETLKKELGRADARKIVIFSEFADTVNYLGKKLKEKNEILSKSSSKLYKANNQLPTTFAYTSKISTKKNKEIIRENFDASYGKEHKDEFNVLVASDSIAEGYNLNRAGTVINYDIPYNPTKVIQRFGRINRINKKVYEELFIYNFFPTDTGEREVRTKKISKFKISMFKALFGDDAKVLTKDEDLSSFFIDEIGKTLEEGGSPEAFYENLIYNIRDTEPALIEKVEELPDRIRVKRNIKKNYGNGILVYAKKGDESIFRFLDKDYKFKNLPMDHYLKMFECNKDEKGYPVSNNFQKGHNLASQRLFKKNYMSALDRGKQMTVKKLEAIKDDVEMKYKNYISDLIYIIMKLDALPGAYLKKIRNISKSNLNKDIDELYKLINPEYIQKIISKAQKIDEGEEHLIISEEISNA